jgi:hypothetical protein
MRLALAFVFVASGAFAQDQIDPRAVTYLHRSIADWPITSSLSRVDLSNGICFPHTKAGQWPQSALGEPGQEIQIEGNPWVFAQIGGRWYGATWDWLRPGQTCKGERVEDLGAHQIRIPPMDGNWIPNQATQLCWAVSTRARDGVLAGQERSNIVCTPNAQPIPQPIPQPVPLPSQPSVEGIILLQHLQDVQRKLEALQGTASDTNREIKAHRQEVKSKWDAIGGFALKYIVPPLTAFLAGWQLFPEDEAK